MSANLTEKQRLEQEIAKLTGAINRQPAGSRTKAAYPVRPNKYKPTTHPYAASRNTNSGHRTLIVNPGVGASSTFRANQSSYTPSSASSLSASASPFQPASGSSTPTLGTTAPLLQPTGIPLTTASNGTAWVKNTTKSGNKTLTNADVHMKAHRARLQQKASRPSTPKRSRQSSSNNHGHGYGSVETHTPGGAEVKRVVIDGVVFQFEKDGSKLTRMDDLSTAEVAEASLAGTPTRSSLSMSGHQYIRTKSGNMISAELIRNRKSFSARGGSKLVEKKKVDMPCRYFTKTGRCQRASTCPFVHDPNRLAICSRFLRGNCPFTSSTCPVSHTPSAHNTPSCAHFQKTGTCKNGSDCIYPHIKVSDTAPVCEAFSVDGWCDRGLSCPERHAWECREFNETGNCTKGSKCGLAHILRAKPASAKPVSKDEEEEEEEERDDERMEETNEGDASSERFGPEITGTGNINDIAEQQDFIQFQPIEEPLGSTEEDSDSEGVSSDSDQDDSDAED